MTAQSTLCAPIVFEGVGLHTGAPVRAEIHPADVDSGFLFRLDGNVRVPATAEYVVDTSRATVLGRDGASVSTIEHVLSALLGMGISNAEIRVNGPEMPVTDGSGKAFADAIVRTGIQEQSAPRSVLRVERPFFVRRDDAEMIVLPSDAFHVKFLADFPAPVGTQYFDSEITPTIYFEEICAARTFGYLHEVEALHARGLALGGSLDNAVVFDESGAMQPLRWSNEVVRHKVLDLLGDLALLGAWPQCEIIAIKSGHDLHVTAARALREELHYA